jgi:hypothetical protein
MESQRTLRPSRFGFASAVLGVGIPALAYLSFWLVYFLFWITSQSILYLLSDKIISYPPLY